MDLYGWPEHPQTFENLNILEKSKPPATMDVPVRAFSSRCVEGDYLFEPKGKLIRIEGGFNSKPLSHER
ncbi:hypothetical protein H9L39_19840 [Fusarium oxysporum f. sp. albedinis]|nr:hypothetical protein H9L39_19843 [Fusarium oxysporum f. sp. albedinis]KAK2468557.1 hypothetical protein H9L39_19840 [Fusarium oxysporum f. sp. albedinis]